VGMGVHAGVTSLRSAMILPIPPILRIGPLPRKLGGTRAMVSGRGA
jgi:hypothetical protein